MEDVAESSSPQEHEVFAETIVVGISILVISHARLTSCSSPGTW
jgi:hypothetical protein